MNGYLLFILQTSVSFASDCSLCSISGLLFPDAWIVLSSAYNSARQRFRWRETSFINNKNSVGPGIEPWGTPDSSSKTSDIPSSLFIDL